MNTFTLEKTAPTLKGLNVRYHVKAMYCSLIVVIEQQAAGSFLNVFRCRNEFKMDTT